MSHLHVGAQKNIVKGPAGCKSKLRNEVGQGSLIMSYYIRFTIPRSIKTFEISLIIKIIINYKK